MNKLAILPKKTDIMGFALRPSIVLLLLLFSISRLTVGFPSHGIRFQTHAKGPCLPRSAYPFDLKAPLALEGREREGCTTIGMPSNCLLVSRNGRIVLNT